MSEKARGTWMKSFPLNTNNGIFTFLVYDTFITNEN